MSTPDHPRIGQPGCTCSMYDDGGPESGPHLAVDFDEACPHHGRQADPQGWAEADAQWPDADQPEWTGLTFIHQPEANITQVLSQDTGLVFRIENGCLMAAAPTGGLVYAEAWRLVAVLADDQSGIQAQGVTDAGRQLEAEAEGILTGALQALRQP